jgi:hypothetical protein
MLFAQIASHRKAILRFAGARDLGEEAWAGREARAEVLREDLAEE